MSTTIKIAAAIVFGFVIAWLLRQFVVTRAPAGAILEVLNVGTKPLHDVVLKRQEKKFTQVNMPSGMSVSWVIQEPGDAESIEVSWLLEGAESRTTKTIEIRPREPVSFDIVRWHRITVKDDDIRVGELATIPILR